MNKYFSGEEIVSECAIETFDAAICGWCIRSDEPSLNIQVGEMLLRGCGDGPRLIHSGRKQAHHVRL